MQCSPAYISCMRLYPSNFSPFNACLLLQPAADVAAAPAAAVTGGWPSLGDSKEPLPKKKQRQQQAVVAPPPPPPASSREDRPAREGRSGRRGSGRGLPLSTLSDSLSAAAQKGKGEGKAAAAEKREEKREKEEKEGGAGAAGDKDAAAGDKEGAAAPAAPAPPPPKPSSERGGSGGGRGTSGRGSGSGGRGSRSNSSTRLAEMAGGAPLPAGGAGTPAAPAAPAPPTPPPPSASIVAAAAAGTAPFEQRSSSGGRGGGEGGRGRGRGGRSGSFRGSSSTYPAAAAAAPAGNFLYSVAAPVFYPPAAYGVSPSMVGMSGTPVSKLQEAVRNQIDYYFSVGNLVRDVFLRSKMNAEVGAAARGMPEGACVWGWGWGWGAAGSEGVGSRHAQAAACRHVLALRARRGSGRGSGRGRGNGRGWAPQYAMHHFELLSPTLSLAGLDPAARHRRLQPGPHAHARPHAHRQRYAGAPLLLAAVVGQVVWRAWPQAPLLHACLLAGR